MNRGLASKVYLYQQSFDPKGVRFFKRISLYFHHLKFIQKVRFYDIVLINV